MGILIFFLGLVFFSIVDAGNDCSTSFCGNSRSPVRFPFKFMYQTRKECGYPGFDLGCNFNGVLSLNLPHSGEFLVRYINYVTQEIQVYDPNDCLPRRLLNLNLSSSPFAGTRYNNYTFLGCPPDIDRSVFEVIDCLSNSSVSVIASSSTAFVKEVINTCSVIATVPVPTIWSFQSDGVGFSSNFSTGVLFLSWEVPDCRICEANGRSCGFYSSSSLETICTLPPRPPPTTGGQQGVKLVKIIGFSVVLPFVILPALFICIICLKCFLEREQLRLAQGGINNNLAPSNPSRFSAVRIQQLSNGKVGLDDCVIEAYPKVILEENCSNVAGSEDLICWICLEEYHPKDTLRCLPNCKHYFHIECIDKWLKINGICPVCRTSP